MDSSFQTNSQVLPSEQVQSAPTHRHNLVISEGDDEQLELEWSISHALRHVVWEPLKEEHDQRKNLCHTRFEVLENICSLVIDRKEALMLCLVHLLI